MKAIAFDKKGFLTEDHISKKLRLLSVRLLTKIFEV